MPEKLADSIDRLAYLQEKLAVTQQILIAKAMSDKEER
jgi:hypothetical protein